MSAKFEQTSSGWRCVNCGSTVVDVSGTDETSAVLKTDDEGIERPVEVVTCSLVGYECKACGAVDAEEV